MITQEITIINKLGLHARAATKFAEVANKFASCIKVNFNEKSIDGKSIMSLMLLAAAQHSQLELSADGPDEQDAINALADLIKNRFGEGE